MNIKLSFKKSILAGLAAAAAAAVLNSILFFVFHGAGVLSDTIFIRPNQPLTIVPILISSILPAILGSIVFFLIEKFSSKGFKVFSIVSVVLLVLSFVNPFVGIPNVTVAYAVVLYVMHVVVAGALLFFINRSVKNNA